MADAERIVSEVADKVRELVAEAEERASEIVREAESEAQRIRERAEAEAGERLADVRKALDELQGRLGRAEAHSPATSEVEPGPVTVPEPEPPAVPEPEPPPTPEPAPEPVPEPAPPPDEGTPPAPDPVEPAASNGGKSTDAGAARLVAMNMALDGAARDEIVAALEADYALDDTQSLVDSILARSAK